MEFDEKIQALRTCAIRRLQQASELADFAEEIESTRMRGIPDEYLIEIVRNRADYVISHISYRYETLDADQKSILESLRNLK